MAQLLSVISGTRWARRHAGWGVRCRRWPCSYSLPPSNGIPAVASWFIYSFSSCPPSRLSPYSIRPPILSLPPPRPSTASHQFSSISDHTLSPLPPLSLLPHSLDLSLALSLSVIFAAYFRVGNDLWPAVPRRALSGILLRAQTSRSLLRASSSRPLSTTLIPQASPARFDHRFFRSLELRGHFFPNPSGKTRTPLFAPSFPRHRSLRRTSFQDPHTAL